MKANFNQQWSSSGAAFWTALHLSFILQGLKMAYVIVSGPINCQPSPALHEFA